MAVASKEYQTSDVERICRIKRVRLQTWLSSGWITPSIQKASGHGTRNIFSENDLYKIAFFKRAIESGISRSAAAQFIPGIEEIFAYDRGLLRVLDDFDTYQNESIELCIFFRRDGEVISSHIFGRRFDSDTFAEFKDFDDAIIINIEKVITDVQGRM